MTQLVLELSQLEIEPIESQEMGADTRLKEQNSSLETLTTTEEKSDLLAILTQKDPLFYISCCCSSCCCLS